MTRTKAFVIIKILLHSVTLKKNLVTVLALSLLNSRAVSEDDTNRHGVVSLAISDWSPVAQSRINKKVLDLHENDE